MRQKNSNGNTLLQKSKRNTNWYTGIATPVSDDDDDEENDQKCSYQHEQTNDNISQQNQKDTKKRVNCVICCEKDADTVFVACGHQALCRNVIQRILRKIIVSLSSTK